VEIEHTVKIPERVLKLYAEERSSLNRAAELSGVSSAEFKQLFDQAGVNRPAGVLSDEECDRQLTAFYPKSPSAD
jgi:Uncharacterised protein family (UPF0175).